MPKVNSDGSPTPDDIHGIKMSESFAYEIAAKLRTDRALGYTDLHTARRVILRILSECLPIHEEVVKRKYGIE